MVGPLSVYAANSALGDTLGSGLDLHTIRASAQPLGEVVHVAKPKFQIAIGEMAAAIGVSMPHK